MVMEYFRRGNLRSAMEKYPRTYIWSTRFKCIKSIVAALVEVHEKGVIHCDLHSGNILIYKDIYNQRISDFHR